MAFEPRSGASEYSDRRTRLHSEPILTVVARLASVVAANAVVSWLATASRSLALASFASSSLAPAVPQPLRMKKRQANMDYPQFTLQGQVALVAGAARGLGARFRQDSPSSQSVQFIVWLLLRLKA